MERHETGSLVGWLGLLQEQPIEHLRTADLTEALFIPAERFLTLWEQESTSGAGVDQHPAIAVVDVLIRLSHANPGRLRQLEEWRNMASLNGIAQKDSAHGDGEPKPVAGASGTGPMGQFGRNNPPTRTHSALDLAAGSAAP